MRSRLVALPLGQRSPGSGDDAKEIRMIDDPTSGDRLDRTYDMVFLILILLAVVFGGLIWVVTH